MKVTLSTFSQLRNFKTFLFGIMLYPLLNAIFILNIINLKDEKTVISLLIISSSIVVGTSLSGSYVYDKYQGAGYWIYYKAIMSPFYHLSKIFISTTIGYINIFVFYVFLNIFSNFKFDFFELFQKTFVSFALIQLFSILFTLLCINKKNPYLLTNYFFGFLFVVSYISPENNSFLYMISPFSRLFKENTIDYTYYIYYTTFLLLVLLGLFMYLKKNRSNYINF
jgi:hypothetical protein